MHTVEQLRSELGKRKLPTVGLKAELEQRLSAAEQQESKKVRTAMNSIADEWLCPITQELPINPVMAEDGKIYERAAIEDDDTEADVDARSKIIQMRTHAMHDEIQQTRN